MSTPEATLRGERREDGEPAESPTWGRGAADRLGDGTSVLVLAPREASGEARRVGAELLGRPDDAPLRVLGVGVGTDATRVVAGYRERAAAGDRFALVDVGPAGPRRGTGHAVERVPTVNDLTGVGIRMTTALKEWDAGAVRVCFDSLTPVIGGVDFERAYRFVDVTTSRVARVGAGHWHLDPRAHDDRTVHRVMSAFDAVVGREDGEWSIRGA
ncbi:MAG: hypothetical protein ABEH47_02860 [Haloferacaceae archaeon]